MLQLRCDQLISTCPGVQDGCGAPVTSGWDKTDAAQIERALQVPGWMSELELAWLALQATERNSIVEIGSYCGRSTCALAQNTKGFVYALDDWAGPRDTPDPDPSSVLARFRHFTQGLPVIRVQCDHAHPPRLSQPDMVFIDGSHEYEDVSRDITYWQKRLASNGLLCGHDINWPGVNFAVKSLLPNAFVVPDTSIWFNV